MTEEEERNAADYERTNRMLERKDMGWNMFVRDSPKYSAVYDEESPKGAADYPDRQEQFDLTQEKPQTQQTPVYPAETQKQAPENYPFVPPMSLQNVQDQQPQQGTVAQGQPLLGNRPIRTFAGNYETTPTNIQQQLANDPGYQLLGPEGKKKFEYLTHMIEKIKSSDWPTTKKIEAIHDFTKEQGELVHVHEEGEAKGAAKAHTALAGQQAQVAQQAQQKPIFSDRQKQLIGQLQASEQQFRMEANKGEFSEDEVKKGLDYYQQAYASIKPVGNAGVPFDPRFAPDQQRHMDWIDPKTNKHLTRDDKDNVQELKNELTFPTLDHLPADKKHALLDKAANTYGVDPATAAKIVQAQEMILHGQQVPPGFLPDNLKAHKGGEKTDHEDVGMNEKEWHAAALARDKMTSDQWRKDNAPASKNAQGVEKPAGNGPLTGTDHDEAINAERKKAGLGGNFSEYRQRRGAKQQPGQPENAGMPTEDKQVSAELKRIAPLQTMAEGAKDTEAAKSMSAVPALAKKMNGSIMNLDPSERWQYVEAMRHARRYDPSIPAFWSDDKYAEKIGARKPMRMGATPRFENWEP